MTLTSITNTTLRFTFNKFLGASLIEKEKFLLDEIRQIREDHDELAVERESLNDQLIQFVKEKELVEVTLPNEVRRLRVIKRKVQREAASDEIFLKSKRTQLEFFMSVWVNKFRRKKLLRHLMLGEKKIDLPGYFNLWNRNARI